MNNGLRKVKNDFFSATTICEIPRALSAPESSICRLLQVQENGHVILQTPDTVACLVYNRDRKAVALVSQKRPAVSFGENTDGTIIEGVAGHIENYDIGNPKAAMARECNEELGMRLDPDDQDFELLNQGEALYTSPGHSTEKMWLGYIEVGDGMFDHSKADFGLAEEGESTRRLWIPINCLSMMELHDLKTFALVQWFLRTKCYYNNTVTKL